MMPVAETDDPVSLLNAATPAYSSPISTPTSMMIQVIGDANSALLKVITAAEAAAVLPRRTPNPIVSRFTTK